MDIVLWILQVLMAITFVLAGVSHAFRYEAVKDQYKWMKDVSSALRSFIGVAEILGGIGLILPALTHVLPWLTPLAAVGLAVIMVLAAGFHFQRKENQNIVFNLILFVLVAFIAYGRFVLVPIV